MIASLNGVVSDKLPNLIIVNVGGVGYGVNVALDDYIKLEPNKPCTLYIYEHIREQAHDLFGFLDRSALQLFEQLLNVNGVGPKMALNLLSIGSLSNIKEAISGGDIRFISQAQGVGKRVAERVVVDLREKVDSITGTTSTDVISQLEKNSTDEALNALISLGYSSQDALKSLKSIDKTLPTEERVRAALKGANDKST